MDLQINGKRRTIDLERPTLEALLDRLDIAPRGGVAVAVNNRVVPKSQWGEQRLEEEDAVEIIRATQGG